MEGLEISELRLSEVAFDNLNKRIDSEYFRKQFLSFFKSVPNLAPLGSFVKEGYRVIYENTEIVSSESGKQRDYPIFVQATDLETPFIKTDNLFYVHEKDWLRYPKGRIKAGELLIEVKGKIEKVSLVPDNFPKKALVTGSLYKLSVNEKINKHYLLAYLICKYGVAFKDRYKTNLLISFVSKDDLYRIPIPCLSSSFQKKIEGLFVELFVKRETSNKIYATAETLLLETLGLTNFKPSTEAVNIKSFKDSFSTTGRLDAEYYQPKYEQMVARIAAGSHARLGALVGIQKSIEPGSDAYAEDGEGLPFLRVADYSKQGITTPQVSLNEKFVVENFDKIEALKPKQDTILFSKDGSVGEAYRLHEDADFITSGAILHLTVKNKAQVLPDYLTLALNSIVVKQQAERDAGGSIILHWRKEEIENVLVPLVDMPIQKKIEAQIQESFKLKAESERLLEMAKRAVEIAIEENEQAGFEFIEQQTK